MALATQEGGEAGSPAGAYGSCHGLRTGASEQPAVAMPWLRALEREMLRAGGRLELGGWRTGVEVEESRASNEILGAVAVGCRIAGTWSVLMLVWSHCLGNNACEVPIEASNAYGTANRYGARSTAAIASG
ncbi:uncharacterized protein TrAtP1_003921 [Trichoderma atroviride]|nr:hypothetical protein TrAtP1_003921 [Trichoderma atroviride]